MSRQSTGQANVIAGNILSDQHPDAPGEWQITETTIDGKVDRYFRFACPLKPGESCGIFLKPYRFEEKPGVHTWSWDGNHDAPTLRPSINCIKDEPRSYGCGWHGYVTAGAFTLA